MRNWLAKFQPTPWLTRKIFMLAALIGVAATAFCWGRSQQRAVANPPTGAALNAAEVAGNPDSRRVVAYLYDREPVSREELGEYLIARFGADRLEFLVNRKIVENEANKLHLYVSDTEVEQRFQRDLHSFGPVAMTEQDFVNNILRKFNKTLYEWKEDVIRPKLMMEKIVSPMIKNSLTDQDLRDGFEARYGPKVDCRMIVLNKDDRGVQQVWDEVHKSRDAFLSKAKQQFIPHLASSEGKVPAIHKHFGDKQLEDAAFRLKPGEVSALIEMPDRTWVILLCEQHVPADVKVTFESKRMELIREMEELRLAQKIPDVFRELQKQAHPQYVLQRTGYHAPPPALRADPVSTAPMPAPPRDVPPATESKSPSPTVLPPVPSLDNLGSPLGPTPSLGTKDPAQK